MIIDLSDPLQVICIAGLLLLIVYYTTRRPTIPQSQGKQFQNQSTWVAGKAEEPSTTRVFTEAELAQYTGSGDKKRIYIGSKGRVYDVSDSGFYEPGSTYGKAFAGRDASIDLATMDVKDQHPVTGESMDALTASQLTVLAQWDDKFASKYDVMGVIKDSPFLNKTSDKQN